MKWYNVKRSYTQYNTFEEYPKGLIFQKDRGICILCLRKKPLLLNGCSEEEVAIVRLRQLQADINDVVIFNCNSRVAVLNEEWTLALDEVS